MDIRKSVSVEDERVQPWQRVWSDGKDVTMQPVASWPAVFQISFLHGWRPRLYSWEDRDWESLAVVPKPFRTRSGRSGRR